METRGFDSRQLHKKFKHMEAIYADTWEDLTVKSLGYHHDHCHHYYAGEMKNLPSKYDSLKTTAKYIFVYREDAVR